MLGPFIAHSANDDSGVAGFDRSRAVRASLRGAPFTRFFTLVFIGGPPTKEFLPTYFTAEGMLVCLHLNLRVRVSWAFTICSTGATIQVDEEAIRGKWGIDSCKPSRGAVIFGR